MSSGAKWRERWKTFSILIHSLFEKDEMEIFLFFRSCLFELCFLLCYCCALYLWFNSFFAYKWRNIIVHKFFRRCFVFLTSQKSISFNVCIIIRRRKLLKYCENVWEREMKFHTIFKIKLICLTDDGIHFKFFSFSDDVEKIFVKGKDLFWGVWLKLC